MRWWLLVAAALQHHEPGAGDRVAQRLAVGQREQRVGVPCSTSVGTSISLDVTPGPAVLDHQVVGERGLHVGAAGDLLDREPAIALLVEPAAAGVRTLDGNAVVDHRLRVGPVRLGIRLLEGPGQLGLGRREIEPLIDDTGLVSTSVSELIRSGCNEGQLLRDAAARREPHHVGRLRRCASRSRSGSRVRSGRCTTAARRVDARPAGVAVVVADDVPAAVREPADRTSASHHVIDWHWPAMRSTTGSSGDPKPSHARCPPGMSARRSVTTVSTARGAWTHRRGPTTRFGVVRRSRGRVVQVESLADFDRRVAAGASRLSGWRVRHVDLTERGDVLARACGSAGATFLGCTFAPGDEERLERAGALVLPALTIAPVDVYRSRLYSAEELYDATPYRRSLDARAYAWSQTPGSADDALARSLHDHAIDEALAAWTRGKHLVGVMGGHALDRGDADYADAARLGQLLGASHVVATGGGPGAMEAANLGGALAGSPGVRGRRGGGRAGRGAGVPALGRRAGCGRRSRSATASRRPTTRSPSRPGTTATSRRTCSPPASRSSSATPSARRSSSRSATPASSSCPAPGALCRRCSRTPARTTTPTSPRWRPWSWSDAATGPRRCPPGRSSSRWPADARWRTACTWSTRVDEAAALLGQAASAR